MSKLDIYGPDDEHNQEWLANLKPQGWLAPTGADRYNLVVIGSGPAGLVAALGAAGLGAKVAIIEKGLLGGDCLNHGCVPSKAVIRAAHAAHAARGDERFGVTTGNVDVDFAKAMTWMRSVRANISHHDSAERLTRDGVDVFLGAGSFSGPDTIEVNGTKLRFARACIATGAHAFVPPIPGVEEAQVLTNETVFSLTERPDRLVVVGSGPIGCELAQTFQRLGSQVTVIDQADTILPREDPAAAVVVQQHLVAEGVQLVLGASIERIERDGDERTVVVTRDGTETRHIGDHVLFATGRRANMTGLGLEAAGIRTTKRGIEVNDFHQTSNPKVYAAGDVCSPYQFTHSADFQARNVIQNALFFGRKRASALVIPWTTYTHPEIAHVGLSHTDAESRSDVLTFEASIGDTDRGRTDGENDGFAKIYADKKGRILGATIVGQHAGELLAEVTLAMTHGITLGKIASTIHSYPTRSEVVFKAAAAYNRSRLTPTIKSLMETLLRWRR